MTDFDQSTNFLLEYFPKLPDDIILLITEQLPLEYVIDWLIKIPIVQDIVIGTLYNHNDLQFLISPTKRPYMNHISALKSKLTTFKGYYQISTFIKENSSRFIPKKVLLMSGGDWSAVEELITNFKSWLFQVESIEIALESNEITPSDLKLLLEFNNLTKIHFSAVSLTKCILFLQNNSLLINHPSLNNIIFLKHGIVNWTGIKFPRKLESLDLSWESKVDITTVEVPASLNELYFNLANVSQLENIKSQISSINLTTLMLTHDGLTEISLKALPSTLTTLDVSENPISKISDIEFGWPQNLTTLLLDTNNLTNASMAAITEWPKNLKTLRLKSSKLTNIACLINLPDSIEILDLSYNRFETLLVNNNGDFFVFPKNLKYLQMVGCNLLPPQTIKNYMEFPENLEKLNLTHCYLLTLFYFKFPNSLVELALSGNAIQDLTSYNDVNKNWTDLVNLQDLDLYSNRIDTLQQWVPPNSLRNLNLGFNLIDELPNSWPLFNDMFNKQLQLVDLRLNVCSIEKIAEELNLPPQMKVLDLSNNSLTGPFYLLRSLKHLYVLNLAENSIDDIKIIHEDDDPCRLYLLNLSYNRICTKTRNKEAIEAFYEKLELGLNIKIRNKKFKVNSLHQLQ